MPYYDFKNLSPERRAFYQQAAILENSVAHAAELKRLENEQIAQTKKDEENERLSEKFRVEREAELKKQAEEKRKQSAAHFEQNLREQFFAGNSHASESDFREMLPELKKRAMLENTESADKSEQMMRQSGSYGAM